MVAQNAVCPVSPAAFSKHRDSRYAEEVPRTTCALPPGMPARLFRASLTPVSLIVTT